MPTETFPSGPTHQPENNGGFAPKVEGVERGRLVNYSEREEYLGRHAAGVALEVFGDDLSRPGMFFTEAGSDHDVPYLVVCEGQGLVTSYNLFDGGKAGARGLNGIVVTESAAEYLRTA